MGNPDLPTPQHILDKLIETVGKPRTNRYSASRGIAGLRRAQAAYYGRRFGVKLDPEREVVATLGSKEGFANMAQAITAPGDVVLVPNPSYPIHAFGFLMAGGAIRHVPAEPGPEFFHALERAVHHSIPKPIAVILCYPANPTAYVADLDFYRDVVAFARRNEVFVLSDLAYAEVYFNDREPPPSVLQVPGALDVTVEFTSMSKTFSMAGLRMGFAVGNQRLIAALSRVKSYLDYGAYTPVQVASAAALNGPDDCIREMRAVYRKRRDTMVDFFARIGWPIPAPSASHVRLGADPRKVPPSRQPGVLEAPHREGRRGGGAGHRLRRARRRLRAHRAGGERAAHPPGGAQHRPFPCLGRQNIAQRRRPRRQRLSGFSRVMDKGSMQEPLRLGIAGLGTVGASVVRLLAAPRRRLCRAARPAGPRRRRQRARPRARPRFSARRSRLARRPGQPRALQFHRRLRRADRRGKRRRL